MRAPLELRDADDATWAVYADELLTKGDPRGELIHLQQGTRDPGLVARERELLKLHERLGGPGHLLASLDATWRHGFLSRVHSPSTAALTSLLTHPSGQLLDELVLDNPSLPLDVQVDQVGLSEHPALRSFIVRSDEGEFRFENEISLSNVLALPALERLVAHVRELSLAARAKRTSGLLRLELSARVLNLAHLAAWTFPSLTELELVSFSRWTWRRQGNAWDAPGGLPELRLPPRFVSGEMAPVLQTLTFSSWSVTEEAATQLVQCLERCPALTRVDLTHSRVVDRFARLQLEAAGQRVAFDA